MHAVGRALCSITLYFTELCCAWFFFLLVETVAIKWSLGRRTQAEPIDDADFQIWTYIRSLPAVLFFSNILNFYADKQKQITHGTTAQHLCTWMLMRQCLRFTWSFCECATACICPRVCICAWSRVSVHGYFSLKRVCMSTILDRAREGCLSVCVPLSVQSSLRQQGAPFQFTHQPQRQGVKAQGITVGDFTFEGQDYQSGDPCEEVMREGDCRGAVGVDGGVVRGRAVRLSATLESEALCFLGSVSAKLHICLTPGAVVRQSGAVCTHSHLFPVLVNPRVCTANDYRKLLFKSKLRTEGPKAALLIANESPLCLLFPFAL